MFAIFHRRVKENLMAKYLAAPTWIRPREWGRKAALAYSAPVEVRPFH